jgi:hypothetical protein
MDVRWLVHKIFSHPASLVHNKVRTLLLDRIWSRPRLIVWIAPPASSAAAARWTTSCSSGLCLSRSVWCCVLDFPKLWDIQQVLCYIPCSNSSTLLRAQIEINRSSMSPSKQNRTGLKNEQHADAVALSWAILMRSILSAQWLDKLELDAINIRYNCDVLYQRRRRVNGLILRNV